MTLLGAFVLFAASASTGVAPDCPDIFERKADASTEYFCSLNIDTGDVTKSYVYVERSDNGTEIYMVRITFSDSGRRKFLAAQKAGPSRQIIFTARGKVIAEPVLSTPIGGDEIEIAGSMTLAEARNIVSKILELE